jgi:alkanesulfonate monooxygenase SsuD/methylene tetrahydromethanopterin reductase-like flavin-dependent oxidoreductase (luciferase family)
VGEEPVPTADAGMLQGRFPGCDPEAVTLQCRAKFLCASYDSATEGATLQFGLFGRAAARRGGPGFDSSEGFRDCIDYNVEAEALGFHSTFVVEHHFTGYGQISATLNLLTWLGARTRRLRLGTAVLVLPWHNPVLLAEQTATLDLLSGGRLDFGIGKGYRYNEFAGFCVPMQEAEARFDECLEVVLKAWTSDQPFSQRLRPRGAALIRCRSV